MSRFLFKPASRLTTTAATVSLALALSLSVSHEAMALCTVNGVVGGAPTAGNDTAVCNDANGALNLLAGDDKVTLDPGAVITGNITGGAGNDLIVINGGTSTNNITAGTGTGSQGDTQDRIFMFGGTITGGEVQLGSGQNNFFFFMGGTIEKNLSNQGSVEINRGSVNSVIVFDGGTVNLDEGIEVQDGNAGLNAGPVDPTIYFRSGTYEAGELELKGRSWQAGDDTIANGGLGATGTPTNFTVIIDPINSQNAAYYEALAAAAANGSTLSTANLNAAINNTALNKAPNSTHQMVFKTDEIEFGDGNDKLTFLGAVNMGDGHHNLVMQGATEITEIEGGGGYDILTVTGTGTVAGGSKLLLGEVEGFEELVVSKYSHLAFEIEAENPGDDLELEFSEAITVDGTSVVQLLPEGDGPLEVELETETLTLDSGSGLPGFFNGVLAQYAPFATGGILQIGAFGAGGDDDDDDDGGEEGGPIALTIEADTFNNGGTLSTVTGTAGDTVTIEGSYISTANNGKFALDTALGDSGSATDKVILEGTVAGTTTIYINNAGGRGGFTGHGDGDGIAIVEGDGFTADSFKLAVNALSGREEVIGGGFAYRLQVNEDEALLQSDILDQVPAYVTAPSVGQRLVSAGLDTLYKRLGEIRNGQNSGATSKDGLIWVRGNFSDVDVDAQEGFNFSQRNSGVTAGLGGVVASDPGARLAVGIFGAYGTADADVDAVIFGAASKSSVDADTWAVGGYATYYELGRAGTGLYVDSVVKADFLSFDTAAASRGARSSSDGDALTASAEAGYGFGLGGGVVLQPQAQIAYTSLSIDGFTDAYGVKASYGTSESLIGRLGLQLQTNLVQPDGGLISPYALFNVYSEFEGDNRSSINRVEFVSDVGGTWYSAGGGVTANLGNAMSFYGSGEYHFGDVEGWQGTGGLKMNW